MSILDVKKLNEPISKKSLEDDGWVSSFCLRDYTPVIKSWRKKYITEMPNIGKFEGGWRSWYVHIFKTGRKWQVVVPFLETETPIFVNTMHDLNIAVWKIFNDLGYEFVR